MTSSKTSATEIKIPVTHAGYSIAVKPGSKPAKLQALGWKLLSRKKKGCFIAEKWKSPEGRVYSRPDAVAICRI